jgi:colanic acid biosynthesis glycosyl transferase WcaI
VTRIVVLCPHFEPDTAPTGTVMTRIVAELAELGVEVHVVTSLPWYRDHRIEPLWQGRLVRRQSTRWGSITRVHPFPGTDRRNLLRRALGFAAYSALAGVMGVWCGHPFRRVDAVVAMSPPLTLGLTGRIVAWLRRGRLIFNIQDVFPDAAIQTGAISNGAVIKAAAVLERVSYRVADVVTVLSDDLRDNVAGKLPAASARKVRVIPNFVDVDAIRPGPRDTALRRQLGIGDEPVVLYAGNLGFSQSLDLILGAAAALPHVTFLVNGGGAAKTSLESAASGRPNVVLNGFVPGDRLGELLATGDIHLVPLRRGLGRVSVPSKTYSILAAARPVVASIDPGTAIATLLTDTASGIAVAPDDLDALIGALRVLLDDPRRAAEMGQRGRQWVERHASPKAVGMAYRELLP